MDLYILNMMSILEINIICLLWYFKINQGYACINNDFNFVKYLLGKKSDPNMKLDNGNTAMHYAFKT